jgi:hypothetical protein
MRIQAPVRSSPFDPLDVAVARNLHVRDAVDMQTALARLAQAHAGMVALSQHPDGRNQSHITAYAGAPGATEASALYGTPDRIGAGLEALRAVGVEHVLLHGGESTRQTVRRFSTEIMPVFTRPHSTIGVSPTTIIGARQLAEIIALTGSAASGAHRRIVVHRTSSTSQPDNDARLVHP